MPNGLHYKGPALGDNRALGGALRNLPVSVAGLIDNVVWFNDFLRGEADYDETADWAENDIGAPTAATIAISTDVASGVLLVNAGTGDDTGIQTEFTGANGAGEFVVPTTNKTFAFGARFKKDSAAHGMIWVGLNETLGATDLLHATNNTLSVTDGIGFFMNEASANLTLQARRSSGSKAGGLTMLTMADDTFVDVAFRVEVATITSDTANGVIKGYYLDANGMWRYVGLVSSTAIPNAGICPAFAAKNDPVGTTHATDLTIDYIWYAGARQ